MKTSYILFSFLMLSVLFASGGNGQTTNIYGKVIDKQTQAPLYGVNICLKDNPKGIGTITNKNGEFRLWNIPSDSVNILINCEGYANQVLEIEDFFSSHNDLTIIYLEEKNPDIQKQAGLKLPLISKRENSHP